jgi:putative AlgH/UPF0301 family transcriptional regulator
MELDLGVLFHLPLDQRWDACLRTLGVQLNEVWMRPVDE